MYWNGTRGGEFCSDMLSEYLSDVFQRLQHQLNTTKRFLFKQSRYRHTFVNPDRIHYGLDSRCALKAQESSITNVDYNRLRGSQFVDVCRYLCARHRDNINYISIWRFVMQQMKRVLVWNGQRRSMLDQCKMLRTSHWQMSAPHPQNISTLFFFLPHTVLS